MDSRDVRIGGYYFLRMRQVRDLTVVQIVQIEPGRKGRWLAHNLRTNRRIHLNSSRRLIQEASPQELADFRAGLRSDTVFSSFPDVFRPDKDKDALWVDEARSTALTFVGLVKLVERALLNQALDSTRSLSVRSQIRGITQILKAGNSNLIRALRDPGTGMSPSPIEPPMEPAYLMGKVIAVSPVPTKPAAYPQDGPVSVEALGYQIWPSLRAYQYAVDLFRIKARADAKRWEEEEANESSKWED